MNFNGFSPSGASGSSNAARTDSRAEARFERQQARQEAQSQRQEARSQRQQARQEARSERQQARQERLADRQGGRMDPPGRPSAPTAPPAPTPPPAPTTPPVSDAPTDVPTTNGQILGGTTVAGAVIDPVSGDFTRSGGDVPIANVGVEQVGTNADGTVDVRVTVTNSGPEGGTFLTPPWVAVQDGQFDIYDRGAESAEFLERLAEDGTTDDIVAAFEASGAVGDNGVITGPGGQAAGPLDPGESGSIVLTVDPAKSQFLNFASMVIPSNDAFVASPGDPTALQIFDAHGNFTGGDFNVTGADVLDAGTEVNTEQDAAFLNQTGPDTGEDEGGVVTTHPGFIGSTILPATDGDDGGAGPVGPVGGADPMGPAGRDDGQVETGFTVRTINQPLESLTTDQTPAQLVEEAGDGNLYFNVHTNDFPGGEIRGQLTPISDNNYGDVRVIRLSANLDAAQEPGPTSDSAATGQADVTIIQRGDSVTYTSNLAVDGIPTGDLMPVAGVSSIHLHNAPAGENGPVITDIIQGAGGDINGNADGAGDTGDGNVFFEAFGPAEDVSGAFDFARAY